MEIFLCIKKKNDHVIEKYVVRLRLLEFENAYVSTYNCLIYSMFNTTV